jgi:hypothetical protein
MILYAVAFSYFFTWFQNFLHKHLLYTSLEFFSLGFLKMKFILCEVQVLNGECYNTKVYSLDFCSSRQPPHRHVAGAPLPNRRICTLSHRLGVYLARIKVKG